MHEHLPFLQSLFILRDAGGPEGFFECGVVAARRTRGTWIIKHEHGRLELPAREGGLQPLVVSSTQEIWGRAEGLVGTLDNPILSRRIIEYMDRHYGKAVTNCATFAEYLCSGVFTPSSIEKAGVMFARPLHTYAGEKIEIGDTVCVLYLEPQTAKSRRQVPAIRAHYRKFRKKLDAQLDVVRGVRQTFTQNEIVDLHRLGMFDQFHYMTCIGRKGRNPIFIHQLGLYDPFTRRGARIGMVITSGIQNPYPGSVPGLLLIRRRD